MLKRLQPFDSFIKKGKSVLVLGPRGSGKSYYFNHLLSSYQNILKVDLLKMDSFVKYLKQPSLLRKEIEFKIKEQSPLIIFIDEIQKVPSLLNEVHYLIEAYKKKSVFILTGSSARKLKKGDANLLAGRALYFPFYPLSFEEINFEEHLAKILQYGTLPDAFLEQDQNILINYLKTYTHVYLKEEILQESLVRHIEGFSKFLELASFMNATPINHSKMAKQIGISPRTVMGHYRILEDTLLATRIPAFTYSKKKQLQLSAKYYFFDNGLLNSLRGELSTELKESSYRYGALFENLIVNELIKYNSIHQLGFNFYHYRTNHGVEIDLILQKNIQSIPMAIEIKSSTNPQYQDGKHLSSLLADFPKAKRYVLCRCDQPYQDKGITFLPFIQGIKEVFRE